MTPDPDPAPKPRSHPRPARLRVDVCDAHGRPAAAAAPGLGKWLSQTAPASARGSMTIALVSTPRMRALNLAYRGKDYATDVLSFPAADTPHPNPLPARGERERSGGPEVPRAPARSAPARFAGLSGSEHPGLAAGGPPKRFPSPAGGRGVRGEGGHVHLGDVVIATGVAGRQAREAGHSVRTELRVLALHGLLHLLGYDHERDAGEMARVERRLRRRGGLREGLIERAV
jgi:ssRNA-specific RNase YbeY (16S rRNA maturation enzyme)